MKSNNDNNVRLRVKDDLKMFPSLALDFHKGFSAGSGTD